MQANDNLNCELSNILFIKDGEAIGLVQTFKIFNESLADTCAKIELTRFDPKCLNTIVVSTFHLISIEPNEFGKLCFFCIPIALKLEK